jgi:hypothetical protein
LVYVVNGFVSHQRLRFAKGKIHVLYLQGLHPEPNDNDDTTYNGEYPAVGCLVLCLVVVAQVDWVSVEVAAHKELVALAAVFVLCHISI